MKQYEFGPFELQPQRGVLLREGILVPLTPKAIALLGILVGNAGSVVTKDEIRNEVWRDVVIDDSSIAKNISILRKELRTYLEGTDPIQTVAKRGYQFTAAVTVKDARDPKPLPSATRTLAEPFSHGESAVVSAAPAGGADLRPARRFRSAWLLIIGSLCLLGLAALIARLQPKKPTDPAAGRRSVVVLPFTDLTANPDTAWFSTALRETLASELETGETLRVVPGDDTDTMVRDLKLPPVANLSAPLLARIGSNLHCDYVVEGTYLKVDDALRVDVYLQDARSGRTIAQFTQTRPAGDLLNLISQTGGSLRSALAVGPVPVGKVLTATAALPVDQQALRFYSEGLARLRVWDSNAALPLLQKSLAIDAGNAAIHSALADAYSMMGNDERAAEEARNAFAASAKLPREQQLVIEGRAEQATRQWDKAIATQTALRKLFPDDAEYGIRLAQVLLLGGKPEEALTVTTQLEKALGKDDPRVYLEEASIRYQLGQFDQVRAAAQHAQQLAQAQDAHILLGRALTLEGDALVHVGQVSAARSAFGHARSMAETYDDKVGDMHALRREGAGLRDTDPEASLPLLQRDCSIAQKLGDARELANCRFATAYAHYRLGDLDEAAAEFESALQQSRALPDKRLILVCLEALVQVRTDTAQWADAAGALAQAMHLAEVMKSANVTASLEKDEALLAAAHGDLHKARTQLETALELARKGKDLLLIATEEDALASVVFAQGDLPAAQQALKEECALWGTSGQLLGLAKCQVDSAELALAQHDAAKAEQLIDAVSFNPALVDPGAQAHRVRGRIALDKKDIPGALRESSALAAFEKRCPQAVLLLIEDRLLLAQVEAAAGAKGKAESDAEYALRNAERHQLVQPALEARLQLAMLAPETARPSTCRALTKDALTSGYGLIALKAQTCSSGK